MTSYNEQRAKEEAEAKRLADEQRMEEVRLAWYRTQAHPMMSEEHFWHFVHTEPHANPINYIQLDRAVYGGMGGVGHTG